MITNQISDDIQAVMGSTYIVTTTERGWVEVRVNPANAIGNKLDFIRITTEDNTINVFHLTHNGCCEGEMTVRGSMAGIVYTVVREFCEAIF